MANDLISRKALIADLRTAKGLGKIIAETIVRFLKKQPTVDAVEVVHGRWVQKEFWIGGGTWRCSECGRQIMFMNGTPTTENMHYCPGCGADMRERKNEERNEERNAVD